MSDLPAVSVIVPARDDGSDLAAAIESVLGQDYRGDLDVVVAVGPSSDDTATVARGLASQHPSVAVVDNPEGGTPSGLNRAIEASVGPVVVRVDARSVLPQGYVRDAVETLRATGAANVGGVQVPVGRTATERAVAAAMRSLVGSGGARYRTSSVAGPADTVYLGVFDRRALDEVGRFDEALDRNQDYELNWRLRAAGHTVWFDPRLRVEYRPRGSMGALARQYAAYGRWKCEVLRRHPRSARPRQLLVPAGIVGLAGSIALAPLTGWSLVVPGAYAVVVGLAAVTAQHEPWYVRVRVPVAVVTMHVSWGVAFLVELVTRSLRRR